MYSFSVSNKSLQLANFDHLEWLWVRQLPEHNMGRFFAPCILCDHCITPYLNHFSPTMSLLSQANGTAVYPPTASIPPCKPGDVIGTYLDLDNGICTFFINGKDYGLTVEFDQPRKQVYETNKARKQKYAQDGRLIKDVEGLGLYPAISLTSHQHIIINFGNQPWMCPPSSLLVDEFLPMAACEPMSPELKHNILKLTRLRGRKCARVPMSSLGRQAAEISGRTWLDSDSESDTLSSSDEKEQVFCTICYSEPHCIQLQPCGHDGLCKTCAKMLSTW